MFLLFASNLNTFYTKIDRSGEKCIFSKDKTNFLKLHNILRDYKTYPITISQETKPKEFKVEIFKFVTKS